ncbi:MAG: PVC-type heme-binding CxxCH protein, partial [Verrucomicrobiota bacterium]
LVNPVQMAFDVKGRLWVAAWLNYPERTPESTKGDSLLVFEDTDHDGKADKCIHFVDDLNGPTGFQFYKDGVILVQAPDVWFLRDTDGDGKADWKQRVINGMDSADSHHTANSLVLDPGGAIYLSDGVFHRTQVETAVGPVRNTDAAIYRFEPRSSKFERYIAYGFANPHGRVFDYWGNDLVTDATGNNTYFGPAFSGHIDYPEKHSGMKEFWERPSRPCPGTGILSSRYFPDEFQDNFLNLNVIGFQGIFRVKVSDEGSGLHGETIPTPLVVSDDPNFRPTAVDVAPDGTVYFADWHNPIIGHMQHHIRDPNRDHAHGRIYRMTYEGRDVEKPAQIAGAPIPALLDLLKAPENNVRTRAKIELGGRDTQEVITALNQWVKQFDPNKAEDQHHLLEALWVHQWMNVVDEALLKQMLKSPEPRARAAAVRVLCYWRDRVSNPLGLLKAAANDESPKVRLQAVRAASFFNGAEAQEVAYAVLKHPMDYYLNYTFNETLRQLHKSPSDIVVPKDEQIASRILGRLSNQDLMQLGDQPVVLMERLERPGFDLASRSAALDDLAKAKNSSRTEQAFAALKDLDGKSPSGAAVADLAMLLSSSPTSELQKARTELSALASSAKHPSIRRAAYAAVLSGDAKPEMTWAQTERDANARANLIDAIPTLVDPGLRAEFQPILLKAIQDSSTPEAVRHAALRALPSMGADHAESNFKLLAKRVSEGKDLGPSARALVQIPHNAWDKELARPVSEAILAWAKSIPAEKRTEQDYVETVQVGMETAALLPASDSGKIRKQLLDLGVRVFVIKTVREQMRYDLTRLVVEAGKPFEIILENDDFMPHNLVITEPGAREEVGTQAQTMQPNPDREGRVFVPKNKKIIAASKLIEPGQKETMKLTAPKTPGDYDYLCSYPEHWKVMFGQLVVVKDADAFLQASAKYGAVEQAANSGEAHEHHHP